MLLSPSIWREKMLYINTSLTIATSLTGIRIFWFRGPTLSQGDPNDRQIYDSRFSYHLIYTGYIKIKFFLSLTLLSRSCIGHAYPHDTGACF